MPEATAADIAKMASPAPSPTPESGFDAETGELRIGSKVYKPLKYTRARRVAVDDLGDVNLSVTANDVAGRLNRQESVSAGDLTNFRAATHSILDLAFKRLALLYADETGARPDVDEAMEELTDDDASSAVEYVVANPTARKTGASSS